MSLIGRVFVVLFALFCASMAGSTMFVVAVLAREWSDVLLPSWQTGVLGVVIGLAAVWISVVVLLPVLAVVAFVAGLCIAPAPTLVTLLVSSYAPARYATEAFTWVATCIVSGLGTGNALGGLLLERYNAAVVFGASAAAALLAAGCVLLLSAREVESTLRSRSH